MTKLILLIFLFILSNFSFGQSSLDSLRLVLPVGHTSTIEDIVFNKSSTYMLSSSRDNVSILYSTISGKEILRFENENSISSFSFGSNPELLAYGSNRGLELMNLKSGKVELLVEANNDRIQYIDFSGKDHPIIYVTQDNVLHFLDIVKKKKKEFKLDEKFKKIELNSKRNKAVISIGDVFHVKRIKSIDFLNDKHDLIELSDSTKLSDFKLVSDEIILISEYNIQTDRSYVYLYNFYNREKKNYLTLKGQVFKLDVNLNFGIFAASSSEHSITLFNIKNGKVIQVLNNHNYFITDIGFNKLGDRFASCAMDSTFCMYSINLQGAKKLFEKRNNSDKLNTLNFSDNLLAIGGFNRAVSVYDIKRQELLFSTKGLAKKPFSIRANLDNKTLLSSWDKSIINEYNAANGQILNTYLSSEISSPPIYNKNCIEFSVTSINGASNIYSVGVINPESITKEKCNAQNSSSFSNDNRFLVTTSGSFENLNTENSFTVINRDGGDVRRHFRTKGINRSANFNCDDSQILISSGSKAVIYDIKLDLIKNSFIHGKSGVIFSGYFNDCKAIIIACEDGTMYLYDNTGYSLLDTVNNSGFSFMNAKFCIDKKRIIIYDTEKIKVYTVTHDNKFLEINSLNYIVGIEDVDIVDSILVICHGDNFTKFISLKSKSLIYERIQLENNNWLVKLPNSPYYMGSKDASKMLHYVTPSLKVIGFEQLDPLFNRPDIVLDSIGKYFGGADKKLVANYLQTWEKRIDRLGLDKEKLGKYEIAVPNAEIVGADAIAYENKNGKLVIKVTGNDPKYPLRRFNMYVNEVPLYGSAGISIAHLKKQVWDTTVSVPLSVGENKIQVSVMNELGLENFKYPTYVNYTPIHEITAKIYYIGIGVNEFKETSHNLKYCVKDVTDLANCFSGSNTEVKLFTDKQVTKENVLSLKAYLNKTTVNDKVIISCSSHGLLDDSLNFYLAMHDVDFKKPQARGLKYEELEDLLDGIPARQKLLLLDACNSGENDKTVVMKKEIKQKEKNMDSTQLVAARGVILKVENENKNTFQKMNELFVNVRNNTGSVIISAAGGQENALEAIEVDGEEIENGAFTFSVLECLKQNQGKELKVNQLKQYTEKRVEEITKGKQKPTSRQETMEIDWKVN